MTYSVIGSSVVEVVLELDRLRLKRFLKRSRPRRMPLEGEGLAVVVVAAESSPSSELASEPRPLRLNLDRFLKSRFLAVLVALVVVSVSVGSSSLALLK